MVLRIPSSKDSSSPTPSPHRIGGSHYRAAHSASPCPSVSSVSSSPSSSSPLNHRNTNHQRMPQPASASRMDTSDDYTAIFDKSATANPDTSPYASPSRNSSANDPNSSHLQAMLAARHSSTSPSPGATAFHHQRAQNKENTEDHSMRDVDAGPTFYNPVPKPAANSSFLTRRPASLSFPNSNNKHDSLSKRLASSSISSTSFNPSVRPSTSSSSSTSIQSLRRSTGLLNLDDPSLGSPSNTRKSTFRPASSSSNASFAFSPSSASFKSPINSSPSVSSISSKSSNTSINSSLSISSDTSFNTSKKYPFSFKPQGRSKYNTSSPFHSVPQKRSHSTGTVSDGSPPQSTISDEAKWREYNSKPHQADTATASKTKTHFFKQPYFSTSESLASPFQGFSQTNSSSGTITTTKSAASTLQQPNAAVSTPVQGGLPHKVRKTGSQNSVHGAQFQPSNQTHPLAFSYSISPSPSPSLPEKKLKSARLHSPNSTNAQTTPRGIVPGFSDQDSHGSYRMPHKNVSSSSLSSTSSFTNLNSVLKKGTGLEPPNKPLFGNHLSMSASNSSSLKPSTTSTSLASTDSYKSLTSSHSNASMHSSSSRHYRAAFKINPSLEAEMHNTAPLPVKHQPPPSLDLTAATPENFKFAKPLQTAFLSTGLLSKRNRKRTGKDGDVSDLQDEEVPRYAPPETPCKKSGVTPKFGPHYSPFVGGISKFSTFGPASQTQQEQLNSAPKNTHLLAKLEPVNHSSPFSQSVPSTLWGNSGSSLFSSKPADASKSEYDFPSTPTKRDTSNPHSNNSSFSNNMFGNNSMNLSADFSGSSFFSSGLRSTSDNTNNFGPGPFRSGNNGPGESPNTSFGSSIFHASPFNMSTDVPNFEFNKASKQSSTASTITPNTYQARATTPTNPSRVYPSLSVTSTFSARTESGNKWPETSPQTPSDVMMHTDKVPPRVMLESSNEPPRTPAKVATTKTTPLRTWTGPGSVDSDGDFSMAVPPSTSSSTSFSFQFEKNLLSHPPSRTQPMRETESDPLLRSRFSSVSLVGKGQFSYVYVVAGQKSHSHQTSVLQNSSVRYAIKKTRHAYSGLKERNRRLEEVDILRKITVVNRRKRSNSAVMLSENNGVTHTRSNSGCTVTSNNNLDEYEYEFEEEGREYIVGLIDSWEYNNHLYIMMEYCENGSLDRFLDESGNIQRLDEWRVWKILVEIALGIRYIHSAGFLHLDLKPANIFITFEGSLKIGDFGMATKYPVPHGVEREGDREYIAPEILNRQMYTTQADIFSLGIMMLEIAANIVLPDNGIHWQKLRSGDLSDAGRLSSGNLLYNSDDEEHDGPCTSDCDEGALDNDDDVEVLDKNMLSPKFPPANMLHASRSTEGAGSSTSSTTSSTSTSRSSTSSSSSSGVTSLGSILGNEKLHPNLLLQPPRSSSSHQGSAGAPTRKRCRHRTQQSNRNPTSHPRSHHGKNIPPWAPRFMMDNTGALDHMVKWLLSPDPTNRPSAAAILETDELRWVEEHRKAGAVIYEGDYGPQPDAAGESAHAEGEEDVDVNWR